MKKFIHLPQQFPQIKRIIAAPLLITVFIIFFMTNLTQGLIFPIDEEKKLRYDLLRSPGNQLFHEKLGQYYLLINIDEAEKEYRLAQEFYHPFEISTGNPLGIESSPIETWSTILLTRGKLQEELQNWQKITKNFPRYGYANYKLAVLSYKLGEMEKAREYLHYFLTQFPLNESGLELARKIEK